MYRTYTIVGGRLSIPPSEQSTSFGATGNTPGCFKGGGDVGREAFIFLKKKKVATCFYINAILKREEKNLNRYEG